MTEFASFLSSIADEGHRSRMQAMLTWVATTYPQLDRQIKWKQPMFMDHGTFIIAFSVAKPHAAVAPEAVAIERFATAIDDAGYRRTKHLVQIPWDGEVDYALLGALIDFNIADKANAVAFWRK